MILHQDFKKLYTKNQANNIKVLVIIIVYI